MFVLKKSYSEREQQQKKLKLRKGREILAGAMDFNKESLTSVKNSDQVPTVGKTPPLSRP